MTTAAPVLEVDHVTKKFGQFKALDDFSMTVEEGSVHGFLGPNGSGKSTTIRTLLGVLHPTTGTVRVLGKDPRQHPEVLRRIGYVPGDVALWPTLTGAETFRALEAMRGRKVDPTRETELIEAFGLDPSKRTRDYSTGNRRKVSLIAALSCDADVLILDEPTAGLDPLMEAVFVEQVQKANERGASVLLSSHILSEVEKLCDYVTVIKSGHTVESGTIRQLRHLSTHTVTARVSRETLQPEWEPNEDGLLRLTVDQAAVPDALRALLAAGATDITTQPASLEQIFMRHYDTGGEQ